MLPCRHGKKVWSAEIETGNTLIVFVRKKKKKRKLLEDFERV
jgi:hypothetical protein